MKKSKARKAKPNILLVADTPNWAFGHVSRAVQSRLSDEFCLSIAFVNDVFDEEDYDLIYHLSWDMHKISKTPIRDSSKYVAGIRSHRSWRKDNFAEAMSMITTHYSSVHAVSKRLQNTLSPFLPGIHLVRNGVDTKFFKSSKTSRDVQTGRLKLGWSGRKNDPIKGFNEFVAPLANIPGVDLVVCGDDSTFLDRKGMRAFYNSVDAVISTSYSEGSCNPILEGASMERAIITTDVGSVPEYLINEKSALIVEQELPNFIAAVIRLRDDVQLRQSLGFNARRAVEESFDWDLVAEDYRLFFREALSTNQNTVPPTPRSNWLTKLERKTIGMPFPERAEFTERLQQAKVSELSNEITRLDEVILGLRKSLDRSNLSRILNYYRKMISRKS